MTVRAKFKVQSVLETQEGSNITLGAVIGGSTENDSFFRWTPSGTINLGVVNPLAAEQFTIGKEVYVDFTPAN